MRGFATACGAATILNAVSTWKGCAFGVNLKTSAEVELDRTGCVKGDVPGVDTTLIQKCTERVLQHFGCDYGAVVRTWSEIPVASGLKSSSTAANAVVLATLDALGEKMDLLEAAKLGVNAAREAGVTVTGALDDALASMLGGIVITDNRQMKLLKRDELDSPVMLLVPDRQAFSRDTDIKRSEAIAPLAEVAFDLAMQGNYCKAMMVNGFAYCAALGISANPQVIALQNGASGVSLSGTGPSYAALIAEEKKASLEAAWSRLGGRVINTRTNNKAATMGRGI